jgi:hypothetical protein
MDRGKVLGDNIRSANIFITLRGWSLVLRNVISRPYTATTYLSETVV